jgi:thiol-disulfide isomerase/thioredoxin
MKQKTKMMILVLTAAIAVAACTSASPETAQVMEESTMPLPEEEIAVSEAPSEEMVEAAMPTSPAWFSKELGDVNSGSSLKIADQKGRVVLVEMMAIWCPKCLSQQKEVARLFDLLGDRTDFMALGIDVDPNENADQLAAYVQQNSFDWTYIVADQALIDEISALYGAQYLNPPSTPMLIIDKNGEVHTLPFGIKSAEDLQSALIPFLDSSG